MYVNTVTYKINLDKILNPADNYEKMTDKAKEAVYGLLEKWQSGDIPAMVAYTYIKIDPNDDAPSSNWSINNQILMLIAGTYDARTYKQWLDVGRKVIKGTKAFYILAPGKTIKKENKEKGKEKGKPVYDIIVLSFRAVPVFRYEDTEGKPLPEFDYEPPELPPLYDVAEKLNIDIMYLPK